MRVVTSLILSLPLIGAYAIFAIGIVLIYRASKVLNLAHGAMAMVPAYLLFTLVSAGLPTLIAFPLAIVAGAALGLALERVFVRRLRGVSDTSQTVGTVAALGILVAIAAKVWGTTPREAVRIFPKGFISVGSSGIQVGELGLFFVMLLVAAGVYLMLQKTDMGLMMRGTAESRVAASLHGVDPDRITAFTWALGGALAALAGCLLAAVTNLNPYVLTLQALPGFIAALIGGLGSLPGALIGAAIVGATQGLVPVLGALGRTEGAPQLLLAILALAVMASRGKSIVAATEVRTQLKAPGRSGTTNTKPSTKLAILAFAVLFPWVVPQSMVGSANLGASYSLVAISIVLLTGWVGQISLGHAALVGIGAYVTGLVAGGAGIPFPLSIVAASVIAAAVAAGLGTVALRVRGLYLAVATLVFSWMGSEFLFRQGWFTAHDQIPSRLIGGQESFPSFDFTDPRIFYYVAWAFVAAAAFGALNLRDSKRGRAFFAVRGSEMAAASLGINVVRTKLVAFALSGGLAGAAGNLLMSNARVVSADQFTFGISLFVLAIAVVGGLASVGGAIASALLFAGLTEVFFRVPALGGLLEIISAILLAVVLLAYPGGLSQIAAMLRSRLAPWGKALAARAGRLEPAVAPLRRVIERISKKPVPQRRALDVRNLQVEVATYTNGHSKEGALVAEKAAGSVQTLAQATAAGPVELLGPREEREPLLEADGVTVQFGGLTAVSNASLSVRKHEIVGLIGPNGAGKTTFFNAIAGFNQPTTGTIRLFGQDVTRLAMYERAAMGVARTFQAIQLFGDLSVLDNLLVATHVHNPTNLWANIWGVESSVRNEKEARDRVWRVLELLEMKDIALTPVSDLPFGMLRMVEVARGLVTGFPVLMLDEPASGLDNNETDRLIEVLRFVRGLGVTQLLIEHDVRMVTSVSDYIYVLDQGKIIAEGTSQEIQSNPAVISAYLGDPPQAEVSA